MGEFLHNDTGPIKSLNMKRPRSMEAGQGEMPRRATGTESMANRGTGGEVSSTRAEKIAEHRRLMKKRALTVLGVIGGVVIGAGAIFLSADKPEDVKKMNDIDLNGPNRYENPFRPPAGHEDTSIEEQVDAQFDEILGEQE